MSIILKKIKKLPDSTGVYFFLGTRKKILYIGKATSLRDRIKSYFGKDIEMSRSPLIKKMVLEARDISFRKTHSILEALILEADLIKKFKPKYNIKEKDDKSFNYVVITKEDFPRIFTMRGREIHQKYDARKDFKSVFGPFPHGNLLKEAIKIIRKIFPFRGKSDPAQKNESKSRLNEEIGLAPEFSKGISKKDYAKNIRNIELFFRGKHSQILKNLRMEMGRLVKRLEFERAGEVKKTIFAIAHIQDISLIKSYGNSLQGSQELWNENSGTKMKIEAYDVAHMSGKNIVGAITVVKGGEPKKAEYRKFNIKSVTNANDTAAIKEILERRLGHNEWPLPQLIVVDGGKAQINVAESVLKKYEIRIPIAGVVKDEHHRPKKILGKKELVRRYEKEILLANSEAHRFSVVFHRKKRSMTMF